MEPTRLGEGQGVRCREGALIAVTGARGGIGSAVARRLLDDGWRVLALDVTVPPESDDPTGQLEHAVLDVSDPASIRRLTGTLQRAGVPVAGLVNVAGVLQDVRSLFDAVDESAERIWAVNYFGAQHCVREFAALMVTGGSIVNVTSINAHRPLPLHDYAPAKVALDAATRLSAGELGQRGIRVNAVAPGFTMTPILAAKIAAGARDPSAVENSAALKRFVDPEEVAAAVSFLMSDDASAITGISLPVDAGWLATSHWMDFGGRL